MSKQAEQYGRGAAGWTDREYADASAYLRHRAELIVSLGAPLGRGATLLDLACGDGGLATALAAHGIAYVGVDSTTEMVDEARRRLGPSARIAQGDLNDFVPAEPVDATTLFRALYYAHDRRDFFAHVRSYTRVKLVFDLNPRQYPPATIGAELRDAGWGQIVLRPFFVPQTIALPRPLAAVATGLERSGPLARLALRHRFTYLVAASIPRQREGTQSNPS